MKKNLLRIIKPVVSRIKYELREAGKSANYALNR